MSQNRLAHKVKALHTSYSVQPTFKQELILMKEGFQSIAGVDEAGRGPLAGPLVAAAVILQRSIRKSSLISLIRDSKTLSPSQRERARLIIQRHSYSIGIGIAFTEFIDCYGITSATHSAMIQAVATLSRKPDYILIDAIKLTWDSIPSISIIKGDSKCLSIASASIIAKTTRDRIMKNIDKIYPKYGFTEHKGYGTRKHLNRLREFGPTPFHRKSFGPIKDLARL